VAPRPNVPLELTTGPFTLRDARLAGLSADQLRGASWRRLSRGLYVWSGLGQGPAVALAAAQRRLPFGVFSGRTAAWLHGLDLPPCDPVEVTVPREAGVSGLVGVSVRRAPLGDDEVVVRRGMPATSALRTIVDLGSRPPLMEAVVAVDMALQRRLVGLAQLRAGADAPARRGIVQLRRVVDLAEPASESALVARQLR